MFNHIIFKSSLQFPHGCSLFLCYNCSINLSQSIHSSQYLQAGFIKLDFLIHVDRVSFEDYLSNFGQLFLIDYYNKANINKIPVCQSHPIWRSYCWTYTTPLAYCIDVDHPACQWYYRKAIVVPRCLRFHQDLRSSWSCSLPD